MSGFACFYVSQICIFKKPSDAFIDNFNDTKNACFFSVASRFFPPKEQSHTTPQTQVPCPATKSHGPNLAAKLEPKFPGNLGNLFEGPFWGPESTGKNLRFRWAQRLLVALSDLQQLGDKIRSL